MSKLTGKNKNNRYNKNKNKKQKTKTKTVTETKNRIRNKKQETEHRNMENKKSNREGPRKHGKWISFARGFISGFESETLLSNRLLPY